MQRCKNCDKDKCMSEIIKLSKKGKYFHLIGDDNAEYQPAYYVNFECYDCSCIKAEPKAETVRLPPRLKRRGFRRVL